MRRSCFALCGVVLVTVALGGCYEKRVVRDSWAGLLEIADPGSDGAFVLDDEEQAARRGQSTPQATLATVYAIRLGEYVGVGRHEAAKLTIQDVEAATDLSGGWVQETGRSVTAFLGRFADPSGKQAQAALQAVQDSGVDQTQAAAFVPLAPGVAAITDPLDARAYRGMMSLQVAFYDKGFGADFRTAAEKAARQLREQEEEAFFYHSNHRSMVLIGLFTQDNDFAKRTGQFGEQIEVYGPRIRNLQQRYPYNLRNGLPFYRVDDEGKRVDKEPLASFVVRIL